MKSLFRTTVARMLIIAICLTLLVPFGTSVYSSENVSVAVNGRTISNDAIVQNVDDRIYVSAREIAPLMGLNLDWNDNTKTLNIKRGEDILTLMCSVNAALYNNGKINAIEPIKIIMSRSVIDISLVTSAFGGNYVYNQESNTYNITIAGEDSTFVPDVQKHENNGMARLMASSDPIPDGYEKAVNIAGRIGLYTKWDDESKKLTFTNDSHDTLVFYVGKNYAFFNGMNIDRVFPMLIQSDSALVDRDIVERAFAGEFSSPDNYTDFMASKTIADILGITAVWSDEAKTVTFSDGQNILNMTVGLDIYEFNGVYYENPAPLIVNDDRSLTSYTLISKRFGGLPAKLFAAADDTDVMYVERNNVSVSAATYSSNKTFSGKLYTESGSFFSSGMTISVSLRTMVYNTYSGWQTTSQSQTVSPVSGKSEVNYSISKSNCSSSQSYSIDYNITKGGSEFVAVGSSSTYTISSNTSAINLLVMKKGVQKRFSGTIRTPNSYKVAVPTSVRVYVYNEYNGSVQSTVATIPAGGSQATYDFMRDSCKTGDSYYIKYVVESGSALFESYGFVYKQPATTQFAGEAKRYSFTDTTTSVDIDLSFWHTSKIERRAFSGAVRIPTDYVSGKAIDVAVTAQSVGGSVYGPIIFSETLQGVVSIPAGKTTANYNISDDFYEDENFVVHYAVVSNVNDLMLSGYATENIATDKIYKAKQFTGAPSIYTDINIPRQSSKYSELAVPSVLRDDIVYTESKTNRGTSFTGFSFNAEKGKVYTITMTSTKLDAFLYLLDENMSVIKSDDDSAGEANAQIVYSAVKTGKLYIQATAYNETLGQFELSLVNEPIKANVWYASSTGYGIEYGGSTGSNSIKVNYSLQNISETRTGAYVFVVVYNYDGETLYISNKKHYVESKSNITDFMSVDLSKYNDSGIVKCFVWDADSLGNTEMQTYGRPTGIHWF